jgi:DNA helicase-2/ATP-dependent DNA helicase PcrA
MITNPVFEALYNRLNIAQKQAVDTTEGSVMVIAGPGTGKTQILTLRIANILLNSQVNPENILALTFTESAVYEMRKRLVAIIGTAGYRVEINTFHGFCNEVIQHNPENFENLIAAESISELEQIQILEEIIEHTNLDVLKPIGDPSYYVRPALSAINDLKKEGVTAQIFEKALTQMEKDFEKIEDLYHEKGIHKGQMKIKYQDQQKNIKKNKELLQIYELYQKELTKRKQYDFNDMLLEVSRKLGKNSELLLRLQEKYQYFLVDEHQDTNASQNKIIEQLASFYENPNLFVVGDEKQAIFRFQGASLENFLYFKHLYKDAVLINLSENYRSTQHILNAAGSLISHNPKNDLIQHQDLRSNTNYDEEKINIAVFSDYFAESYWIAEDIKAKMRNKIELSDMVIIVRNNRDVVPVADALEHTEVPYVIESEQNVLEDLNIEKIMILLRLINTLGNDMQLVRAMHIDTFAINPLDIYKLIQYAHEKDTPLWNVLAENDSYSAVNLENEDVIKKFYKDVLLWKTKSQNESFDDVFVSIINESGILKSILNKKNAIDILDKLTVLYGEIKIRLSKNHRFNIAQFLEYIDLLEQHNIPIKKSPNNAHKIAVRIMTAHKSKGLEFDYVYIPQAYDNHWGNQRKKGAPFQIPWEYVSVHFDVVTTEDKNEDERRLFYVAITRAKKSVYISYSTMSLEGREQVPSQFIEEISDSYQQSIPTKGFEEKFLSGKEIILTPQIPPSAAVMNREYRENKKFFKELFLHKGLSVSGLNNYLDCPWKYFFRNLLALPDVKKLNSIFGTAIHQALNRYLSRANRHEVGLDFIMSSYRESLLRQAISETEIDKLLKWGNEMLPGFYEHEMVNWDKDMKSELEIRGVKLREDIILNGRIDMVEMTGKDTEVIVHDFKTGTPKSRNEIEGKTYKGTGDYKRQLVFYKILLDRYHHGKMKMTEGVINFVKPTDRGAYKKEVFVIDDKEVEELEDTIIKVSDEIMNLSFWDRDCGKKDCEYCELRKLIER